MPEQLMCPMRSDAKTVRHCQPDKCMWGKAYDYEEDGKYVRCWICAIFNDSSGLYQPNGVMILCPTSD